MAEKYIRRNWSIWLMWTLVNIVGFALGIGLSLAANEVAGEILSFVAFGIVIGFAQWLVLRRIFQGPGWWILATCLGATLGLAGTNAIHSAFVGVNIYFVAGSLGMAALGLMVGIAQWWILREYFNRAGWWILVSAGVWLIGGVAVWALRLKLLENIKIIADFSILGIIVGSFTGWFLVRLTKRQSPEEVRNARPLMNMIMVGSSLGLIILASVLENSAGIPDEITPPPDLSSVTKCSEFPSWDCPEDDNTCSDMVFFEPTEGPGYINYPINGEVWDDQYRSYLRRDLRMSIQSASARVACETDSWEYKYFEPLGLGDMSEVDGAIPGTSTGYPDHPPGTHEDGNDIDVAYFQTESNNVWMKLESRLQGFEGNLLRSMCKYTRFGMDVYHCTEPPRLLDPWRTALFIAYVAENPYTRVIGVDGQIGPLLDEALDHLSQSGWIKQDLRDQIPLVYETTNEGMGWFRFHHHHMHISMYLR